MSSGEVEPESWIRSSLNWAILTVATLEGALILTRSLDDPTAFDAATAGLLPWGQGPRPLSLPRTLRVA